MCVCVPACAFLCVQEPASVESLNRGDLTSFPTHTHSHTLTRGRGGGDDLYTLEEDKEEDRKIRDKKQQQQKEEEKEEKERTEREATIV